MAPGASLVRATQCNLSAFVAQGYSMIFITIYAIASGLPEQLSPVPVCNSLSGLDYQDIQHRVGLRETINCHNNQK